MLDREELETARADQALHDRHLIAAALSALKADYKKRGEWDCAAVIDRAMTAIDGLDLHHF